MPEEVKLNIIFAGTPEFGLASLDALASVHNLQAVYTQPDRPLGRGRQVQFSPIKQWALDHGIPVLQPENFKSPEAIQTLAAFKTDLMVVMAYGLILPKIVLDIPRLGCINVHASLLPHLRGASPIQGAILAGDKESGVSIMQMDVGMDTGDILAESKTPILPKDTAATLHDRLAQISAPLLLTVIEQLATGKACAVAQNHAQATYTKKIAKEEAHLNWHKSALCLAREVRAYYPWPVSFTFCGDLRIRVIEAEAEAGSGLPGTIVSVQADGIRVATADGLMCIRVFQFAGGKVLPVSEWIRGGKPTLYVGQCLI